MRMILNADDFGYDIARNQAIEEAFKKKLCTQCSLMVNMPGADDAVERAFREGFAPNVALLLNLTVGNALTEEIQAIPEVCTDGRFNGRFHHHILQRFCAEHGEAIAKELEAQFRRFIAYGLPMRHADSHHWVQLDRKVALVIPALLKAYGFRSFRRSENIQYLTSVQIIRQRQWYRHFPFYLRYYDRCLMPSRQEFRTVDYVGRIQNIAHAPKGFSIDDPNGSVEFLFHPIYQDGVLWDKGVASLAEMVTPIIQGGFELISYNDL